MICIENSCHLHLGTVREDKTPLKLKDNKLKFTYMLKRVGD